MIIILKITLFTSILSLISTAVAMLIGITQKAWRKRDGVLFFNIFAVDILFSCTTLSLCTRLLLMKTGVVTLSNIFVFMFFLSWVSQCIITVNRYIMVSYPFGYKTILPRSRFCLLIGGVTMATIVAMLTSIGISKNRGSFCRIRTDTACGILICEVILPHFSGPFLVVILILHFFLILPVYLIEGWLWRTAKRHRHRFHSLTSSINGISRKNSEPDNGKTREEIRKSSLTQTIMKKISLTSQNQRPPVQVHGTPPFYLAAHLLTLLLYMTIGAVHLLPTNDLETGDKYNNVCMTTQLLMSLRPMINIGNHLSTKSLKRFTKLIQKVAQRDSRELFTEYYYENDEEVKNKMSKRKEAIRLHNEEHIRAASLTT